MNQEPNTVDCGMITTVLFCRRLAVDVVGAEREVMSADSGGDLFKRRIEHLGPIDSRVDELLLHQSFELFVFCRFDDEYVAVIRVTCAVRSETTRKIYCFPELVLHSVDRKVADDVKVAKKRADAGDAGGAVVFANCKVVTLIEEIAGVAIWSDEVAFASFDVYDAVSSDVVVRCCCSALSTRNVTVRCATPQYTILSIFKHHHEQKICLERARFKSARKC